MYFVLALGMFRYLGYARVWGKLTAGLGGPGLPGPSEKALRDLRRRMGPAPLRALCEVVAGPLAQPHTPGVRFAGLRTVAVDGLNSRKVPDTAWNRLWAGKMRHCEIADHRHRSHPRGPRGGCENASVDV